jgi:polysaccharide export outer membrane protein
MNLSRSIIKKACNKCSKTIILTLLTTLLFSCSNKKNILFRTNEKQATSPLLAMDKTSASDFYKEIIQSGDELGISNLSDENLINGLGNKTPLNILIQVDAKGYVVLPVIGSIKMTGLTIEEAEIALNKEYKKTTLAAPLFVITITNLKVTLLGEFFKQGNFGLGKPNTTLTEILGEAGGFNTRADQTKLKIIRGDKTNPEVIHVDLTNIATLGNPKLQLRNGDIIYCQPRKIYLFSDKLAPVLSYVGIGTSLISLIYLLTRR